MSVFAETDILRAAQSMIRDHGRRAAEKATQEVLRAVREQRPTAADVWRKIERQIRRLEAESESEI